ncbi:unnamed protein product [Pleuronectes platessa]|uniref:Uncharacterized protein n=1 Tax=Pleuronectes platessa TaxID=8262 RepID=A0A9N7Z8C9_PLEPL|nr:unnamed protein product [Pleuronectes platessa]
MNMDIDSILSIVTSYFEGMTSEQWNLSKAGKPDVATITILGEKLLEIVYLETQSTLKDHVSTAGPVSQNSVICSFGNTLPQIFAQALDVPDEVKLVSSEKLTRLIAKEIAECVNSVLSMSVDSGKETIPRITPPKRLQCLIQQAGQMIKGLMRNLKCKCAPCKSRKKLESGSTLEMKNVADDVAEVIVDEIMMQNQVDLETAQSSPSLKKVCGRIRTCAAKQFAQASIGHLVERLNIKYFDSPDNPAFDKGSIGGASLPSDDSQGSGSESEVTTSEFTEEYSEEQESTEDGRKLPIRIIVMKLVTRIFNKAKVLDTLRSPNAIIERLVENIWVEIQDEDFEITPKMMQRLDKIATPAPHSLFLADKSASQ